MSRQFDHERLKVYTEALRFVAWVGPLVEDLPGKFAARDQLDRASTSVVLNLAEGNGKRSRLDRCRHLDIARGSAVECAAALDVLVARGQLPADAADQGKAILIQVVSMIGGLIAHFSEEVQEPEQAPYGETAGVGEKE